MCKQSFESCGHSVDLYKFVLICTNNLWNYGATLFPHLSHSTFQAVAEDEEEMDDIVNDPEFLQNVLEGLPGVDPQSEAIQTAMGQLQQQQKDGNKKQDGDKK